MNKSNCAKQIIESLLFSTNEPINIEKITEILTFFHPYTQTDVKMLIEEIRNRYLHEDHYLQLDEIDCCYVFRTKPLFRPYIEKLKGVKKPEKLSNAALEVLAIIAHKQPITKSHIESIRGVDSSNLIHGLLEKELIEVIGKDESPGRPLLFGTTFKFLQYFSLKTIEEIPKI
jgi:segregation and condensation protein B